MEWDLIDGWKEVDAKEEVSDKWYLMMLLQVWGKEGVKVFLNSSGLSIVNNNITVVAQKFNRWYINYFFEVKNQDFRLPYLFGKLLEKENISIREYIKEYFNVADEKFMNELEKYKCIEESCWEKQDTDYLNQAMEEIKKVKITEGKNGGLLGIVRLYQRNDEIIKLNNTADVLMLFDIFPNVMTSPITKSRGFTWETLIKLLLFNFGSKIEKGKFEEMIEYVRVTRAKINVDTFNPISIF